MHLKKRTILYRASLLMVSSVLLQLMGFLFRIIISRLAGAEGMGVYQLVLPIYSVLQSITLSGLIMASSRLCAEQGAVGNYAGARGIIRRVKQIFLLLFSVTAAGFALFSTPISEYITGDSRTRTALLFLIPCLLLTGFENLYKSSFHGLGIIAPPIISELSEQFIRIVAVGLLLFFAIPADAGEAAALIILGMVISEMFSSSFLHTVYKRTLVKKYPTVHTPPGLTKKILGIALPVCASGISANLMSALNTLLIPQRLIVSGMDAISAMKTFGIVSGMTLPLVMLPSAFIFPLTTVLVPKLAEGQALGRPQDLRRKAGKAIHVTALIGFPAAAVLITLGPSLAEMIYGQPEAGRLILPFTLGAIGLFYQVICGSVLNGIGMQKRTSLTVVTTGILELVLTWILVANPSFGIRGYAVEYLLSGLLGCLMNMLPVIRHADLNIRFRNWFVSPFLAALLCGITIWWGHGFCLSCNTSPLGGIVWPIVMGGSVYLAALRFQGVQFLRYLKNMFE